MAQIGGINGVLVNFPSHDMQKLRSGWTPPLITNGKLQYVCWKRHVVSIIGVGDDLKAGK